MAVGEFISVSSQKDSEMADIEKERVEQAKGAPKPLAMLPDMPGTPRSRARCRQQTPAAAIAIWRYWLTAAWGGGGGGLVTEAVLGLHTWTTASPEFKP